MWSLSFFVFLDHPGFHYSPEGEKKDSLQTKEGPTPRRGRRKGEKLQDLLQLFEETIGGNYKSYLLCSQSLFPNYWRTQSRMLPTVMVKKWVIAKHQDQS